MQRLYNDTIMESKLIRICIFWGLDSFGEYTGHIVPEDYDKFPWIN